MAFSREQRNVDRSGEAQIVELKRDVSIGFQKGPRIGAQKGPQARILLFGPSGAHPSVPAHACDELARGAAVKNGRFFAAARRACS